MPAPLIVFAYNRPNHLKKTLNALSICKESKESVLFIYIDGPKNESDKSNNDAVYDVAKDFCTGFFKQVFITRGKQNKGLAQSVIDGVSDVINKYGKVIVTEDDAVCSKHYLKFMNDALEFYASNSDIWSVGGYLVPLKTPKKYCFDVIKTQRMSSYSWATWKDRWDKAEWNIDKKTANSRQFKHLFRLWGNDRLIMLEQQSKGEINSWAIRYEYSMVVNKMYNIFPKNSLINNIGHDGSGTHGGKNTKRMNKFIVDLEKAMPSYKLEDVPVNSVIRRRFCKFYSLSLADLLKIKIVKYLRKKGLWKTR